MIVYPNAKINIGLNIISKRSDGFHNIESCFFPINLKDILEIVESGSDTEFESSGISIPGNPDNNLCVEAWNILHAQYGIPPVNMHLHKIIPIGAGLGGGSADGAFALKALNNLFKLELSNEELKSYAARMGSDCAFFIENKPAFGEGRGELLSPVEKDLKDIKVVLINPGIHIGTAEAYSGITPKTPKQSVKELVNNRTDNWQEHIKNDFEPGVFLKHPEIERIKTELIKAGALYASMSGSGSSVFGLFSDLPDDDFGLKFKDFFYWQGKFL